MLDGTWRMAAGSVGAATAAWLALAAPALAVDCRYQCRTYTVCPQGQDCTWTFNNCLSDCNSPSPVGPGWNLTPEQMREPPGGFGAFALSADGQTIGKAKNWDTETGARGGAVRSCATNGATGCRTVFVFRNRCAALAMTRAGLWGAGAAQVPYAAKEAAMKRCTAVAPQGCRLVSFQCSGRG